jgi:hypothetical protein
MSIKEVFPPLVPSNCVYRGKVHILCEQALITCA